LTRSTGIPVDADHALQDRFAEPAREHDVPGAVVVVLQEGVVTEAATGVLNRNTGVEVTTDALFRIGSVTKLYTATLAMCLVHDSKLELDAPVKLYLPEFKVADPEATNAVTVRMILTHTSGLDGDPRRYQTRRRLPGRLSGSCRTRSAAGHFSRRALLVLEPCVHDSRFGRRAGDRADVGCRAARAAAHAAPGEQDDDAAREAILHRAAVGHLTFGGHRIPGAALVPTDV
jgi:CubicO group peptidase (beta-lactamase class C family)